MYRRILEACALLLLSSRVSAEPKYDLATINHYLSRPDIKAPKWDVTVHDRSRVTPGYWFLAPFEDVGQNKAGEGWIGPFIYDGEGELIWSGAKLFGYWNVYDFRISNVLGENHMTLFTGQDGMATVLGDDYRIKDQWRMGTVGIDMNTHELNFVNDGTRVLFTKEHHDRASLENSQTVGWEAGDCKVIHQGFVEMDVRTWEPTFTWSSAGHVFLNESSVDEEPVDVRCNGTWSWDYFHINSIDKSKDGDFFVSGRHVDTLYKVSGKDGSILWRLGGRQSDFEMNGLHFSRQHDIRYRGENETHTFLTFLDNAKGQDGRQATAKQSRGMFVALQTDVTPMIAHTQLIIDHPEGASSYAWRRGNLQKLPNNNVWVQWSEQAMQSEHAPDGTVLMTAKMATPWMGTYRSYKFPFVGQPSEPIAVHSAAFATPDNGTRTLVHVSWNGATEVESWNLYKTTHAGEPRQLIANLPRQGFETPLAYSAFASYVIVEAIGKQGVILGTSDIFKTIPPTEMNAAVADEVMWLQDVAAAKAKGLSPEGQQAMDKQAAEGDATQRVSLNSTPVGLFFIGFVVSVIAVALAWRFRARRIFNFAIAPFRSEKSGALYSLMGSRELESNVNLVDSHVYCDK